MIPIGDDLPTLRRAVATYLIIAACFAVWILVQGAGMNDMALVTSVCNLGMVPGELTHRAPLGSGIPVAPGLACLVDNQAINIFTPLISMFLHGSWGHILGNMLYLYVFGNNVEDSMGRLRFVAFYIICGLIAAATHIALNPASPVPTVGASGAISGVLGGYLVLYPRARIRTFFPPIFIFYIPAWVSLILWFLTQLVSGLPELMTINREVSSGVAVWAHIGGFIAGVVLIRFFARPELVQTHRIAHGARYGRSTVL
ncbi:MAG TPA: rhomboid family intramembrane serine protease [Gemmatimonadaceae bacterium]|nr:rhomboid family intramembrane serine protease [Gemmatimonadaceae bacterium]